MEDLLRKILLNKMAYTLRGRVRQVIEEMRTFQLPRIDISAEEDQEVKSAPDRQFRKEL